MNASTSAGEAKRQKYAALSAAAAERDGDGANEVEPGISGGKVLAAAAAAAEKARARRRSVARTDWRGAYRSLGP